ncbi:hypothetical protein CAJAP_09018 [Camponotus japonicus]
MEQRANIKFCFKLGKSGAETYETLKNVYGDECMSRAQVFRWFGRFRDGREDLADDDRAPPPKTTRNKENIEKVKEILRSDRCVCETHRRGNWDIEKHSLSNFDRRFAQTEGLCALRATHSDRRPKRLESSALQTC